jgi:hypothetical protein
MTQNSLLLLKIDLEIATTRQSKEGFLLRHPKLFAVTTKQRIGMENASLMERSPGV